MDSLKPEWKEPANWISEEELMQKMQAVHRVC